MEELQRKEEEEKRRKREEEEERRKKELEEKRLREEEEKKERERLMKEEEERKKKELEELQRKEEEERQRKKEEEERRKKELEEKRLKEEEEKKEKERLMKEEEERRKQEMEELQRKEEEEKKRKREEEEERRKKELEEKRLREEEEKKEKERLMKEEEERRKQEMEELQRKEEEVKKKKREEEEERRKKELEDKRKREEEEKQKKEEELRLKREEEERIKKEEEEKRKQELEEKKKKEEEEKKRKEEELKKKKEEDEKRKKEEDERKRKEEEERKEKELEEKKKKEEEIKKRKEEEERKKKEKEEKKKKEEEEKKKKKKEEEEKRKKELEDKKKEEEAKKKKILEDKKKKEEEAKKLKEKELNKKKEEAKMKEEAKKLKEKELQKKKEEEDKKKEELRKKKEAEAKKKKELEDSKKKEEEEKKKEEKKKKKEEEEKKKEELKKKKEMEEKKKEELKKKKEEETKKKKELEDAKKKEEELKKKKMLEEKKKKDLEEKKKKEEENKRKKELEEKKKKELEERKKELEEKKKKELEERKKELEEKKKKELEEKRKKLEAQKKREEEKKELEMKAEQEKEKEEDENKKKEVLRAKPAPKKTDDNQAENPQTEEPLKQQSDAEKENANPEEEKDNVEDMNDQKPKKKKKKVKKTITKVVKKKVHKDSLEYQNYLKEKERGFKSGGGGGGSSGFGGGYNIIPKSYASVISKPVNVSHPNENLNYNSDIQKNTPRLRGANNNERELKTLKYYQDDTDNKFDTIGTKEFYQLNKDRYLNDLWKEENDKNLTDDNIYKNKKKDDFLKADVPENQLSIEDPLYAQFEGIQDPNLSKDRIRRPNDNENPENIYKKKNPERIKCSNCNQISPITMMFNCNTCRGKPICKNCAQNHNASNPNHIIKLLDVPDEKSEKPSIKVNKNKKKEKELLKCSNCGVKDVSPNDINAICPTCNLILCSNCQNNHYTTNPSHEKPSENKLRSDRKKPKLIDDKTYKKKNADVPKCGDCGKTMGGNNDIINKCNNCQATLCDNCGDLHTINNPGHNIVKFPNQKNDKNEKRINFSTKCKACNSPLPLDDEECVIVNCFDCNGNLCDDCCDNHEKYYQQHDYNPMRVIFIENMSDFSDSIPRLKCGACRKNINDNNNIYYCDECQIDLCDGCGEKHSQEAPDHDLLLTKRILLDDNVKGNPKCRQCDTNLGDNDNSFKKCDKCKINLCNACGDSHIVKYPNHNLLSALPKKNYDQNKPNNDDYNNKELDNRYKTPNDKCINCLKKIKINKNNPISYCNDCNGNLCDNCDSNHNEDYPDHVKVKSKVKKLNKDLDDFNKLPIYKCIACDKKLKGNLNEPFINCDKCHGNICDDCNKTHLKEFPTHKLSLLNYIIEGEDNNDLYDNIPINYECVSCFEKIPLNPNLNYCNECKGNLCNNCIKLHNKENKTHKPKKLNPIIIEKTKNNIFVPPNIICNSCGNNLTNDINDYLNNCPKCQTILCDQCLPKHNKENPNHNTNLIKYIFCDYPDNKENNDINSTKDSLKSIPIEKCSVCSKNLRPGNNKPISHCNKCKGNLCDSCDQNHAGLFPGHNLIIKKYIINKNDNGKEKENENDDDYIIKNDKCSVCRRIIPIVNNGNIIYCYNCSGNICDSCGSNHVAKNPDHKIYILDTIKRNKPNNEIYSTIMDKCDECGNKIDPNTIYSCNMCDNNLCDNCTNSHLKNKPDHNIVLIKTIDDNDYPIECNVCGRIPRDKNGVYNNYKCDKCLVNFCEPCRNTHLKKYPHHIIKKSPISLDKDSENRLLIKNDRCNKCKQKINLKKTGFINYCHDCKDHLCNNCYNIHAKDNPEHYKNKIKVCLLRNRKDINKLPIYKCIVCDKKMKNNLSEPYNNCYKCHGNLCDDCIATHPQEFPGHQLEYIDYIIADDDDNKKYTIENIPINFDCMSCGEKMPLKNDINYCNDCKGNLCNKCLKLHNKNNTNHNPRLLNIKLIEKGNNKNFSPEDIDCTSCGINLNKNINNYIYNCPKCNHVLCNNCSVKHNKEKPDHSLLFNKYIFYENKDNNYDNNNDPYLLKNSPEEKCKVCNRNIKLGNNKPISHCTKCQGNLCDSCEPKHNNDFPGHDMILNKYIIYKIPNDNEYDNDNKDIDNINVINNDRCLICYNNIPMMNNGKVTYCSVCPGSICDSCNREHNRKYKDHKTLELPTRLVDSNNNKGEKDNYKNNMNKCGECNNRIKPNCMFNCNNCNNNLCNKCANSHMKKKPEHEIVLTNYIYEDDDNVLCNLCGKTVPIKNGSYCDNCQIKLCDQCNQQHLNKNPNHLIKKTNLKIRKYIPRDNLMKNIDSICRNCNKPILLKNNDIIYYCDNCKGNLCDNCNNNHHKDYPNHKKSSFTSILVNKDIDNLNKLPIYRCIACDKILNGDLNEPFISCDKCHGNICDDCNTNHVQEFPTHKLKLIKYIISDDKDNKDNRDDKDTLDIPDNKYEIEEYANKPRIKVRSKKINIKQDIDLNELDNTNDDNKKTYKMPKNKSNKNINVPRDINCMSCNSKINDFNQCCPCYGYLCSSCNDENQRENKYEIIHPETNNTSVNPSSVNCITCNEFLLKDLNKPIIYCSLCNGNLCPNCSKNHLAENPSHILLPSKFIISQYIANNGNESNNNMCSDCNKNIGKNSKLTHYCNQCKSIICLDCVENHNNEYPEHILILSKNLGSYKGGDEKKKKCLCNLCKSEHNKDQNKKFYYCKECNGNICESCLKQHDEENYSHIAKNPHSFEDHSNKY